ncbi:unnamed protein product [Brassicogethes aeneus]|uniref:Lipase n=1 Tax=Brassicogethes aeneus TaxID=1431903 RepID=A0A9P0BBN2_BRAAE|nr:unnamed protein product [Brassicogethes aeneus]
MKYFVFCALFALTYANVDVNQLKKLQALPEFAGVSLVELEAQTRLTVPDLIESEGYPSETYEVTTEDGYILTLHRIPLGKNAKKSNGKVAFLQHGILSSSCDWIITGSSKGLAYILADEGYDVWMGNARGNRYSRNHTTLNPDKDSKFWKFSWHQIGAIDLPTMIDFVLEKTGVPSVYYAGHSQGTTSFFVMTSFKPEYNEKIKVQVSLAPIGFMNHMTSPFFRILAFWGKPLGLLLDLIGVDEFLPNNAFMDSFGSVICGDHSITQILCENVLFALCGFSNKEMNATLLPTLMAHTPAGSSTRQIMHYGQEINSGHFRQYDFGLIENEKVYKTHSPPDYKLSQVTAPVYMLYSHNDWLAAEKDVTRLCDKLGNCKGMFLISIEAFNHLDFMYGLSAPKIVYPKVISLFSRH